MNFHYGRRGVDEPVYVIMFMLLQEILFIKNNKILKPTLVKISKRVESTLNISFRD